MTERCHTVNRRRLERAPGSEALHRRRNVVDHIRALHACTSAGCPHAGCSVQYDASRVLIPKVNQKELGRSRSQQLTMSRHRPALEFPAGRRPCDQMPFSSS